VDFVIFGIFAVLALVLPLLGFRVIPRALPPAEVRYDNAPQSSCSKFLSVLITIWVIPIIIGVAIALI
jgi:hypothetical protein